MIKPKYLKELGNVDIEPVIKLLLKASENYWSAENTVKENKFNCFHHTQHIVLRFIKRNKNHRDFYDGMGWPFFQPVLQPVFEHVVKSYNFSQPEYPKVMFARLQAKQKIDIHRDGAGSNLHTHKIHIPLQTNSDVKFIIADKQFYLKQGMAYEVNNIVPHGVLNEGDQDRIHLIFEVFNNQSLS